MNFDILRSIEVLSSTPACLRVLLSNLSDDWIFEARNESKSAGTNGVWQPFDIVGHLIHGEMTDWVPRVRTILAQGESTTFVPFDRFAQFENSKGKSMAQLLDEFERLRSENIDIVRGWRLTAEQLDMKGRHPELGQVTIRQLLATWVVHDLNHVRQIATAMAKRYESEVGPWKEYLSILNS